MKEISSSLADRGETAYLVGGSVRDLILGRVPKDWDIATTATPKKVMETFARVIPTGIEHGTVTVMVGREGVEITTLRGEGAYSDGRRPDSVVFLNDIEADLARRDFTINAIAWEPITRVLHDPFNGRADLQAGIIRAVGVPSERFKEDSLRVMRAARFAATLEMSIEPVTLAAIPESAPGLARVSAERKRDELLKILRSARPSLGLAIMRDCQILQVVIPSLAKTVGDPDRAARVFSRVDGTPAPLELRLAALLADIPGKGCGTVLESLKLDRKTMRATEKVCSALPLRTTDRWTEEAARRLLFELGPQMAKGAVEITRAHLAASGEDAASMDDLRGKIDLIIERGEAYNIKGLELSGADLITELEIPQGPDVGRILEALLDAVLKDPSANVKETLLDLAREISRG